MKRLLLATIVAVVVATPISVAWGSGGTGSGSPPAAKIEGSKQGGAGENTAPMGRGGAHGDGQCPFAETPAI